MEKDSEDRFQSAAGMAKNLIKAHDALQIARRRKR